MRALPPGATPAAAVTPVLADLAGYQFEVAPMLLAVLACIVVRIYKGAKSKTHEGWVVDVSITVLSVLFTVALIITARPGVLMALIYGTGLGAIGAGLIYFAEKKTRDALGAATSDDPVARTGRLLRKAHGPGKRPPADMIEALRQLPDDD
jgi:tetrahydromethanopterin S-methyltransferase subunit E